MLTSLVKFIKEMNHAQRFPDINSYEKKYWFAETIIKPLK